MDKVLIFGHKNPDTDSVCGAIALSYLKNKLGNNTEPRILGSISKETAFVLNKFKVPVPRYLNDVKVQIKDVKFNKNYLIEENRTIYDAFNIMNKYGLTGLPIVNKKKVFQGYVSLKEIVSDMVANNNTFINTTMDNILSTLTIVDYLKIDDTICGRVNVLDDWKNYNSESIIITTNVDDIKYNNNLKLIIYNSNKKMSATLKSFARNNKINVIVSNESLFNITRVICLSNPINTIKRNQVTITFNEHDYLSDFNEETSKLKHTNYPIVDNQNICLGMLRTIDAKEIKRKKVILVDHNTLSQSVDGLYEADILEIIDHHNLGDINTSVPINFRSMSVGSVSTIIYYMFMENKVSIPKYIAGLLLSGIISDTLLLASPTTTDVDRLVAKQLSKISGLDIKKYGLELLSSGVSIDGLTANEIIFKDFKTYKVSDDTMAIAQVFTTSFSVFKPRMEELIEELNRLADNHDYKVCALFITDFLTNDSCLLYSKSSKRILEMSYGIENLEEGMILHGIVSRKKQMVPNIMSTLEHI